MRPASSTAMAILNPSPSSPNRSSSGAAIILKHDLAGRRSADAQLGFLLAAYKPGFAGIDQERSDATVFLLRVGHGKHDDIFRHRSARNPRLAPIDDICHLHPGLPGCASYRHPSPTSVRSANKPQSPSLKRLPSHISASGLRCQTSGCHCRISELFTDMIVPWAASTLHISSNASTYARVSIPAPPYSSGTSMPIKPISPIFLIVLEWEFAPLIELCCDRSNFFLGKVACCLVECFHVLL